MSVSHARCCLLMLKTAALYRCALCMFCCLPVVYVLGCVLVREATKIDIFLPVRTYKIGLIQRNPGNRLIHSRRKKDLQCSDLPQTSTTGSGRPSCVDVLSVLAESARTKRYDPKQTKKSQIYVYITGENYQSPSSGPRSIRVIPNERNIYFRDKLALCHIFF